VNQTTASLPASNGTVPAKLETQLKKLLSEPSNARSKILIGSLRVLKKKGLADCAVEDILQAADVSRGSFYQYFQNKYDVAATLFRAVQAILVKQAKDASVGERRPFVRLENTFAVYVNAQVQLGWLYSMLLAEAKQIGSPLAEVREEVLDTLINLVDSTFSVTQGRKVEKDVYRALIYALEDLMLYKQSKGKFSEADARHLRNVMQPIIQRTMAMAGDELMDLPLRTE